MVVALVAVVSALAAKTAQGANEVDASTIGVGAAQSSSDDAQVTSESRITGISNQDASVQQASQDAADAASGAEAQAVMTVSDTPQESIAQTQSAERSITVKDPEPVVVPVAVDMTNQRAVDKANEVCTLNPFPTAPHVAPNVNDGSWSVGVASAYSVATNDDGRGHFGVTSTASGIALSEGSVTVAVPAAKSYLMGSIVELCYDGKVVIATVTDTGGFAKYGRDLDLAPGVYKAFGFSTPNEWGTRSVHYRFL